MRELIQKLFTCLNLMRDFEAGYSSDTFMDGLMMISYKGNNYAVKIVEMDENEDPFNAVNCVKYYFR